MRAHVQDAFIIFVLQINHGFIANFFSFIFMHFFTVLSLRSNLQISCKLFSGLFVCIGVYCYRISVYSRSGS